MKLTPWMLTVAAFGIISLLAAGFLFKKLFANPVAEVKPPEARVLPMAITTIEPGTVITRAHVGNGRAEAGAELSKDTLTTVDGVIGRIAKEQIDAAVPLRGSMFYSPGDHPVLDVAAGKRAVSVRVSDTTSLRSQKLKAEQYVDVQLTVDGVGVGGGNQLQSNSGSARNAAGYGNAMTATLFKGVRILSLPQGYTATSLSGAESPSVTLELDEEQARIILLAQRKGEIDLVYNQEGPGTGGIDIQASEKDRITFEEILGLKPEPEKEKPFKTEHYRGSGHSTNYFHDGERVGGDGSRDGNNGTRLQNGGSDWSTDAAPSDRQKTVAQLPAGASSDL